MGSCRGVNQIRLAVEKCMDDKQKVPEDKVKQKILDYDERFRRKVQEEEDRERAAESFLMAQKLGVVTLKDTDPPTFSVSFASHYDSNFPNRPYAYSRFNHP